MDEDCRIALKRLVAIKTGKAKAILFDDLARAGGINFSGSASRENARLDFATQVRINRFLANYEAMLRLLAPPSALAKRSHSDRRLLLNPRIAAHGTVQSSSTTD